MVGTFGGVFVVGEGAHECQMREHEGTSFYLSALAEPLAWVPEVRSV